MAPISVRLRGTNPPAAPPASPPYALPDIFKNAIRLDNRLPGQNTMLDLRLNGPTPLNLNPWTPPGEDSSPVFLRNDPRAVPTSRSDASVIFEPGGGAGPPAASTSSQGGGYPTPYQGGYRSPDSTSSQGGGYPTVPYEPGGGVMPTSAQHVPLAETPLPPTGRPVDTTVSTAPATGQASGLPPGLIQYDVPGSGYRSGQGPIYTAALLSKMFGR